MPRPKGAGTPLEWICTHPCGSPPGRGLGMACRASGLCAGNVGKVYSREEAGQGRTPVPGCLLGDGASGRNRKVLLNPLGYWRLLSHRAEIPPKILSNLRIAIRSHAISLRLSSTRRPEFTMSLTRLTFYRLWCKLWTKVRQPAGAPAEFTQPEQLPRFRTEFAPEFPYLVGRTALCECDA